MRHIRHPAQQQFRPLTPHDIPNRLRDIEQSIEAVRADVNELRLVSNAHVFRASLSRVNNLLSELEQTFDDVKRISSAVDLLAAHIHVAARHARSANTAHGEIEETILALADRIATARSNGAATDGEVLIMIEQSIMEYARIRRPWGPGG